MIVDFHCHSDHSDGTDSVETLVKKAKDFGVKILSVTDHDTVSAQKEVRTLAVSQGMGYIYGVEISCTFHETLDILGYGYDDDTSLEDMLSKVRELRNKRNYLILRKLEAIGIHISENELYETFPGESLGRPHIASILVSRGKAMSVQEAFNIYIGKNGSAFVEKEKLGIRSAVDLILSSNGLPVLAHPLSLKLEADELEKMLLKLKSYGLKGMEVFYKEYSDEVRDLLLRLSVKHGLIATGGSDYHGEHKKHLEPGVEIPDDCVERFLESLNRRL